MITYATEPCNSLKREPFFWGIPQQLFFLWVGLCLFLYILYTVVSAFDIKYLTVGLSVFIVIVVLGSFYYLKTKGPSLNIGELQKKFIYLSRPHWIKAK